MPPSGGLSAELGRDLFRLGDLVVDSADVSVHRGAERLTLPPRTFDLLLVLLRRHPCLVRRAELLDSVWRDEHVTDQTLSHRVMVLRKALGDHADHPVYVAGERGFGYRLVAPVERVVRETAGSAEAVAAPAAGTPRSRAERSGRALPGALIVLPLAALGLLAWGRLPARSVAAAAVPTVAVRTVAAPPDIRPVADGLASAIATRLRRVPGVRLARLDSDSPTLRVEVECRSTARDLRTSVRLVDAATGRRTWMAEYAGGPYEMLDRESEVAAAVARAVHERVDPGAGPLPAESTVPLRAARHALRAEEQWFRWTREGLADAAQAWAATAAAAPRYADAHAGAALTGAVAGLLGYEPAAEAATRARAHVRRAAELAPDQPSTRLADGVVRLLFDADVAGADALVRAAVAEDAEDERGPVLLALLAFAEGRYDEAASLTEPGPAPRSESSASRLLHARALEGRADWAGAAAAYGAVLEGEPAIPAARIGRAACLERLGRTREARATLAPLAPGSRHGAGDGEVLRAAWSSLCRAPDLPSPERPRVCAAAGDLDAAREALRRSVAAREPFLSLAARSHALAGLGSFSGMVERAAAAGPDDTNARRP